MYSNQELAEMHYVQGLSYGDIRDKTGLTYDQVVGRIKRVPKPAETPTKQPRLSTSPYPRYDSPLETTGDALCLFDTEFPFHHADFINRCFDLAQAWGITNCIIGGDVLHFDQFSQWEAQFIEVKKSNSLTDEMEKEFRETIQDLPPEYQGKLMDALNKATGTQEEPTELSAAKKALLVLGELFERVDYVIGNHDDRFIRALKSPLLPQSLLDFIGLGKDPRWRIAPFYRSFLISGGESFQIEHPKSASANTAIRLADKYETNVIVGHSHLQSFAWSTSGRHYAIAAGCCVDELRLPYAAQRSTNSPAHAIGAVIVREGYPYLLTSRTPWARMVRMG